MSSCNVEALTMEQMIGSTVIFYLVSVWSYLSSNSNLYFYFFNISLYGFLFYYYLVVLFLMLELWKGNLLITCLLDRLMISCLFPIHFPNLLSVCWIGSSSSWLADFWLSWACLCWVLPLVPAIFHNNFFHSVFDSQVCGAGFYLSSLLSGAWTEIENYSKPDL